MIQENELMTLMLCVGALFFIIINYVKLKSLPGLRIFIISFIFFTMGWFFTVIEGIIFEEVFNLIEHICYISSSIAIFIWTLILFKKRGSNEFNSNP
jgi:hypothetical protein